MSTKALPRLHPSWLAVLGDEFEKPYITELKAFLEAEIAAGKQIYPKPSQFFAALDRTPLDKVKVVILGQDPYHGPGQAHGLSFSVPHGVPKPPSLRNILTEMAADIGVQKPSHGCLEVWADRGVLLLNTCLSVEDGQAASHAKRGWEQFTDRVIQEVNARREHVVFVLWGGHAQKKADFVDRTKHHVLASAHPSPLSASRGFMGSRPFSKINAYLASQGVEAIDWRIE